MSQPDNDTKHRTDVRQLIPLNGADLANSLIKYDEKSNIKTNLLVKGPAARAINNETKLEIDGVEEDYCKYLMKYGITLNVLIDNKFQNIKAELAKEIAKRIKNTEDTDEKSLDDIPNERKFFFSDKNLLGKQSITRQDQIVDRMVTAARKQRDIINKIINLMIIFDIRLYDIDLSKRNRKTGVQVNHFKILWKLIYEEDVHGGFARQFHTIAVHLFKEFIMSNVNRSILSNKTHDEHKLYHDNLKFYTKNNKAKGNGFAFFGNDKIQSQIESLHNYGFRSEAVAPNTAVKRKKKRTLPRSEEENDSDANINTNNSRKGLKLKHGTTPNSSNSTSTSTSLNTPSTTTNRSNTNTSINTPSTTNFGAYSMEDSPNAIQQSYYDSVPEELINLEGRQVWSSQHHPNIHAFVGGGKITVLFFFGIPAKTLECELDLWENEPRCTAEIKYEIDIRNQTLNDATNSNIFEDDIKYTSLPKRTDYNIIIPLPQEFKQAIFNPQIDIYKNDIPCIKVTMDIAEDKYNHIKNSLQGSLKFNVTENDECKKILEFSDYNNYLTKIEMLNAVDEMISPQGIEYYYMRRFASEHEIPTNVKGKKDIAKFWKNNYETAANWRKVIVETDMNKSELFKSEPTNKENVLLSYGFDEKQFDDQIQEKKTIESRSEISTLQLVVEWPTILQFSCAKCGWKSDADAVEWNQCPVYFCEVCAPKIFTKKSSIDLNTIEETQISRGFPILVFFKEEKEYVSGAIYAKFARKDMNNKEEHVLSMLLANSERTTEYIMNCNDNGWKEARANAKLLMDFKNMSFGDEIRKNE